MKFSTKIRYGLRVMYELANNYGKEDSLFQKDIAKAQELPNKYLDQIIEALKNAHLITRPNGKSSGYVLTKAPSEIQILEIHNAFSDGLYAIDCLSPHIGCNKQLTCPTISFWAGLNENMTNYFQKNTLQNLLDNNIIK